MAPGTDEAQRQRELTKQALATSAGRLEQKVRAELDWKARLRRDGPRYAAIAGGAIVLVGTIVFVRSRLRGEKAEEETVPVTLDDLVAELQALRKEVKKGGDKTPVWQKVALRAVTAAGSAGGAYAAKRLVDRQEARGRGLTAIVIRPMAQSAPSSLVISTSQIQVVRPRWRGLASAWIVPLVIGRRKLMLLDIPTEMLPASLTPR